jgi:hypothetical protein
VVGSTLDSGGFDGLDPFEPLLGVVEEVSCRYSLLYWLEDDHEPFVDDEDPNLDFVKTAVDGDSAHV